MSFLVAMVTGIICDTHTYSVSIKLLNAFTCVNTRDMWDKHKDTEVSFVMYNSMLRQHVNPASELTKHMIVAKSRYVLNMCVLQCDVTAVEKISSINAFPTGCLSIFRVMYERGNDSDRCENECTFVLSVFLPCIRWETKLAGVIYLPMWCIGCIMW